MQHRSKSVLRKLMTIRVAYKNILYEWKRELGNWAYIGIIVAMPVYIVAKLFGVNNKNYERKDYP